jgi:hypothetical protein
LGLGEIWLLVTPKPKLANDLLSKENIICNKTFYIKLDVKHKKSQKKMHHNGNLETRKFIWGSLQISLWHVYSQDVFHVGQPC